MKPFLIVFSIIAWIIAWGSLAAGQEATMQLEIDRLSALNNRLAQQVYSLDETDPETGKKRIERVVRRAIEIEGVDWGQKEVDAMVRLCWRESRYNPLLQNPRSTAFGLWQFLDSTWKYYGIEKTTDPLLQTIAAVRYIEDRYGTPRKALEFHLVAREVNGVSQHYY
jgi:hypothetical protein